MNERTAYMSGLARDALTAINAVWKPPKRPAKRSRPAWVQWQVHFKPGHEGPAIKALAKAVKRAKFVRFMTPQLQSITAGAFGTLIEVARDRATGASVRVAAQYDPGWDTTRYRLDCIGSKS